MGILSTRIKELLAENKITMYKMAKDFECSKATISNWCSGINEPKATEIARIALYFNVSSDFLLGLEDRNEVKLTTAVDGYKKYTCS